MFRLRRAVCPPLLAVCLALPATPQEPAKRTLDQDLAALRGTWIQKSGATETRITFDKATLRVVVSRSVLENTPFGVSRGKDITATLMTFAAKEEGGKRSLVLFGQDARKASGSLAYRIDGARLTLTGSGRARNGRTYNLGGAWLREGAAAPKKDAEAKKDKPAARVDVKAPSADQVAKHLAGLGFSVPASGQTLGVDYSNLLPGFQPYVLEDVICKHAKSKAEIFFRVHAPGKSSRNVRASATRYYLSSSHAAESSKALLALAARIDRKLADALTAASAEWKKDPKKGQSVAVGELHLRVNAKGLAIMTKESPTFEAMGFGGFGRTIDKP